jgi:hypothetical protein
MCYVVDVLGYGAPQGGCVLVLSLTTANSASVEILRYYEVEVGILLRENDEKYFIS